MSLPFLFFLYFTRRRYTVFQQVLNISSANHPKQPLTDWNHACAVRRRSVNCANPPQKNKNECNKRFKSQSKSLRYTLERRRTSASFRNVSLSTFLHLKSATKVTGRLWVSLFLFKTVNTFISLQQGCVVVLLFQRKNVICTGIQSRLHSSSMYRITHTMFWLLEMRFLGGERNANIMNKCFWRINMFTA